MNTMIPKQAKWAFTTRNVNKHLVHGIDTNVSNAVSGDLVMAKITKIGSHKRIQLASGRTSLSHEGDIVILCCGDRYAPDQFEGVAQLSSDEADLLAGGGLIGHKRFSHGSMSKPTQLQPLGLLTERNGQVINIHQFTLSKATPNKAIQVIAVCGTAMNSGKTTTAYSLVNGFSKLDKTIAALKVTGTGAFGDFNAFYDAGADMVLDFTDVGMASTYKQPMDKVLEGALTLIGHAQAKGAEIAVVELGDGILQEETWKLLNLPEFQAVIDQVFFAAPDALSAIAGLQYLQKTALPIAGVSGLLTRSPLLCQEYELISDTPTYTKDQLVSFDVAQQFARTTIELIQTKSNPTEFDKVA